ncbi:MAG: type II secretion system F family protein [Candidatus Micrarchaeota archaeon]|nr:type II secretion system F family protein [Candidatus Micrarchaeota archaeon]
MDFVVEFAGFWSRFFSKLSIDPQKIIPTSKATKLMILQSGIDIQPHGYSSFVIGVGLSSFVLSLLYFTILALYFQFTIYLAITLSTLMLFISTIIAMHYFDFVVNSRARDVELNLLDSLRHMLSELRSGIPLHDAIASIAMENYGVVSELFRESLVSVKEGEEISNAFLEISMKTPSITFQRFVATLSYALGSGVNIVSVLENFIREIELSRRNSISVYTNESAKYSILLIFLTGIIPGVMVLLLSQGSILAGFRIAIPLVAPFYLLLFPLAKYLIILRLVRISPGI